MTDATSYRSHGRMPSDEQMDGLLRDFFRLEVPTELDQPFCRNRSASMAEPTLEISPSVRTLTALPRSRRVAVVSALVVLALSLMVVVQMQTPVGSGKSTLVDKSGSVINPVARQADLLLVSPQGDLKASPTVGADGVTLDETDGVELNPHPRD